MRSYGRSGRYRSLINNDRVEFQEFSDGDENAVTSPRDDSDGIRTPKSSTDTNSLNSSDKPSEKRAIANLEVFDFLDRPVRPKRRKTLHPSIAMSSNEEAEGDNADDFFSSQADQSFQSTIEEANTMLSQISDTSRERTDWAAECSQKEKLYDGSLDETDTKVRYGKTRTMIYREDEISASAEGAEEAEVESDQPTQHFNHLKSMGESLKYQDDLEFMMQKGVSLDPKTKLSNALNIALGFLTNAELLAYAVKYAQEDVWRWSLELGEPENLTLLYLRAVILSEVLVESKSPPSFDLSLEDFVAPLARLEQAPVEFDGNQFAKSNYHELLGLIDSKPGVYYALRLWNHQLHYKESIDEISAKVLVQLLVQRDSYEQLKFQVLESLLSKDSNNDEHTFSRNLMSELSSIFAQHMSNGNVIKALVKLTNGSSLDFQSSQLGIIMSRSVNFMLDHSEFLFTTAEGELLDTFVLHLGLILNMVQASKMLVSFLRASTVNQLQDVMQKLHAHSETCLKYTFNQNMFILIFSYISQERQLALLPAVESFLKSRLESFSTEIEPYNKSIHHSIITALK